MVETLGVVTSSMSNTSCKAASVILTNAGYAFFCSLSNSFGVRPLGLNNDTLLMFTRFDMSCNVSPWSCNASRTAGNVPLMVLLTFDNCASNAAGVPYSFSVCVFVNNP